MYNDRPVNDGFGQLENELQCTSVMYACYGKITTMQPNHRFYHHIQLLLCWLSFWQALIKHVPYVYVIYVWMYGQQHCIYSCKIFTLLFSIDIRDIAESISVEHRFVRCPQVQHKMLHNDRRLLIRALPVVFLFCGVSMSTKYVQMPGPSEFTIESLHNCKLAQLSLFTILRKKISSMSAENLCTYRLTTLQRRF